MGSTAWRLDTDGAFLQSAANRLLCHPAKSSAFSASFPVGPENRPESPDCTADLWKTGQSSELVKYHLNQTNALGETVAWPEGVGLGLFLHSSVLTAGKLSGATGWVFKTQHMASMPQKGTRFSPTGSPRQGAEFYICQLWCLNTCRDAQSHTYVQQVKGEQHHRSPSKQKHTFVHPESCAVSSRVQLLCRRHSFGRVSLQ